MTAALHLDIWRVVIALDFDYSPLLRTCRALRALCLAEGDVMRLVVNVLGSRAHKPDARSARLFDALATWMQQAMRVHRAIRSTHGQCPCERVPAEARWSPCEEYGSYEWFFRLTCAAWRVATSAARSCTDHRVQLCVGHALLELEPKLLGESWAAPLLAAVVAAGAVSRDVVAFRVLLRVRGQMSVNGRPAGWYALFAHDLADAGRVLGVVYEPLSTDGPERAAELRQRRREWTHTWQAGPLPVGERLRELSLCGEALRERGQGQHEFGPAWVWVTLGAAEPELISR